MRKTWKLADAKWQHFYIFPADTDEANSSLCRCTGLWWALVFCCFYCFPFAVCLHSLLILTYILSHPEVFFNERLVKNRCTEQTNSLGIIIRTELAGIKSLSHTCVLIRGPVWPKMKISRYLLSHIPIEGSFVKRALQNLLYDWRTWKKLQKQIPPVVLNHM